MAPTTDLLRRGEAVLVVVDVQERINAVMADQGHLVRIAVLVEACAALGVPVVATEQYPKGLGPTVAELGRLLSAPPVVKETFSCAREPLVRAALEATGRPQAIVVGIEAHVCVLQTALDLVVAGCRVHVPHDAVSSRRPADKEWALRRMASAGVVVTTTESALFELLERCGTDEFKLVAALVKCVPVPKP
jgi:nicotinamidase-related amidase